MLRFFSRRLSTTIAGISSSSPAISSSYLVGTCGLSPEAAGKALRKLDRYYNGRLPSRQPKPDSVLEFFRSHGFSPAQIGNMVSSYPRILLFDPKKKLKAKMEFFLRAAGSSVPEATKLVAGSVEILVPNLEKRIIPSFDFLRSIVPSDEGVLMAFRRAPRMLSQDFRKNMEPNIKALIAAGVPEQRVSLLVTRYPHIIAIRSGGSRISESMERLKELGFHPADKMFVHALHSLLSISPDSFRRKLAFYKSFGLSEEAILSGFRMQPTIMCRSEDSIRKSMSFFMDKLKWDAERVLAHPSITCYSIEKRVAPRASVIDALFSKGLLSRKPSILWLLTWKEEDFVTRYVSKYQEQFPEVLEAYRGDRGAS